MAGLPILPVALALTTLAAGQQTVSFPTLDGGQIYADIYGSGSRAVILAHGGRFNKESWRDQAQTLASADSESWQSTSADSAAQPVPARLISITLHLRTMSSPPFAS